MSNLKETWVRFLETCPLFDIICPLLQQGSVLKSFLALLQMTQLNFMMINTALILTSNLSRPDAETKMHEEMKEIIEALPGCYTDWTDKLNQKHNG